jgi:hypothetical protein
MTDPAPALDPIKLVVASRKEARGECQFINSSSKAAIMKKIVRWSQPPDQDAAL